MQQTIYIIFDATGIPFIMDKIERACKNYSKERAVYAWTGNTIF